MLNPKLHVAVEELVGELSKFTLAGGVQALAHDDFIDTLNQLAEMETFAPAVDVPTTKVVSFEEGVWIEAEDNGESKYGMSTVF